MYGKVFQSLYTGTLSGHAHEILVFTNMIAFKDQDQYVDKHPRVIAAEVGLTVEEVQAAILNLEGPDPESRSPEQDGARIVRADEHRTWGWYVVNGAFYDKIRDREERREQNRLAQQRKREKEKAADSQQPSSPVITSNHCQPTETDTETEIPPAPRGVSKELLEKIGKLYGQPQRMWASHEFDMIRENLTFFTDENIRAISRFYAKRRKDGEESFSGDMRTLLRDPQRMLDKAIQAGFLPTPKTTPSIPGATSAHEPPPTRAEFPTGTALTDAVRESLQPTTKKPTNENTETRDRQPEAHNGAGD